MSKVAISGNNSGTGTFTIAAPDSNNNRTFDLPDEAGTVLTNASDLEPQVKDSLNATGDAPMFACRAFCNFNGEGTVSIRASGNVSSITDNGTGNYTVNFTTAITDTNYSAVCTGGNSSDNQTYNTVSTFGGFETTTSVRIAVQKNGSTTFDDSDVLSVAIFR